MVATRNAYQRAIDKASAMGGTRNILGFNGRVYSVRGSVAPTVYAVRLSADGLGALSCNCPAGQRDIPCWHAATCWLARKGEQAARPARVYASEPLPIRRPMIDESEFSAQDLVFGLGR